MKKVIVSMLIAVMLMPAVNIQAQTIAAKKTAAPLPTPQNVLAWAKELLPELEKSLPALRKINPATEADKKAKARFLEAADRASQIITKGSKISVNDAKKQDAWFRLALSESLDECLTANPGSECCFAGQYSNQGWGRLWYRANCFTIRFPGIS
jgi:hypothetical protein